MTTGMLCQYYLTDVSQKEISQLTRGDGNKIALTVAGLHRGQHSNAMIWMYVKPGKEKGVMHLRNQDGVYTVESGDFDATAQLRITDDTHKRKIVDSDCTTTVGANTAPVHSSEGGSERDDLQGCGAGRDGEDSDAPPRLNCVFHFNGRYGINLQRQVEAVRAPQSLDKKISNLLRATVLSLQECLSDGKVAPSLPWKSMANHIIEDVKSQLRMLQCCCCAATDTRQCSCRRSPLWGRNINGKPGGTVSSASGGGRGGKQLGEMNSTEKSGLVKSIQTEREELKMSLRLANSELEGSNEKMARLKDELDLIKQPGLSGKLSEYTDFQILIAQYCKENSVHLVRGLPSREEEKELADKRLEVSTRMLAVSTNKKYEQLVSDEEGIHELCVCLFAA